MRLAIFGSMVLAGTGAATAQVMPCPAPGPFYTWPRPVTLVAGAARRDGRLPAIVPGRATTLTLAPTNEVHPEMAAARIGGPAQYGGLASFQVPLAGTYRVGLSDPAWVEIGTTGRPAASIAHAHGEECAPVRKTVDYRLAAGSYVLQLSAAPDAVVMVAVVRLP